MFNFLKPEIRYYILKDISSLITGLPNGYYAVEEKSYLWGLVRTKAYLKCYSDCSYGYYSTCVFPNSSKEKAIAAIRYFQNLNSFDEEKTYID